MSKTLAFALAMLPFGPLPSPLRAQAPDHLVGITRTTAHLRGIDHAACARRQPCAPAGFPDAQLLPAGAGGTAWDPFTSGAWITNGAVLAKVADDCTYQCPPTPLPMLGNAVATGLEVVERLRRLLVIDDRGFLHTFTLDCPPQHLGSCPLVGAVSPLVTPTGLAVDEDLQLVFVAVTDLASNQNAIVVAPLANRCQLVQRIEIQGCPSASTPFGSMTGLAVDWCRRILYATDGTGTMAIRYVPAAANPVAVTGVQCCSPQATTPDPMIGLAVRPGTATVVGTHCSNGVCPPCPMRFSLGNDPVVGNVAFHLDLDGAPDGSLAWALIGLGPCAPLGAFVPPLCGPVHTIPLLGAIGPVPTGGLGGGVCSGSASFRLGLPPDPTLCGVTASSQAAVLCASLTGQIGTALSHCLGFRVQGS